MKRIEKMLSGGGGWDDALLDDFFVPQHNNFLLELTGVDVDDLWVRWWKTGGLYVTCMCVCVCSLVCFSHPTGSFLSHKTRTFLLTSTC